jgi:hypothetical protein
MSICGDLYYEWLGLWSASDNLAVLWVTLLSFAKESKQRKLARLELKGKS